MGDEVKREHWRTVPATFRPPADPRRWTGEDLYDEVRRVRNRVARGLMDFDPDTHVAEELQKVATALGTAQDRLAAHLGLRGLVPEVLPPERVAATFFESLHLDLTAGFLSAIALSERGEIPARVVEHIAEARQAVFRVVRGRAVPLRAVPYGEDGPRLPATYAKWKLERSDAPEGDDAEGAGPRPTGSCSGE